MFKVLFLLTFFLFFPTLNIAGSFISLQEFFLYAWALLYYKQSRKIKINPIIVPFFIYLVLFFFTISISAILTSELYSQYDIYLVRSIFQLLLTMLLFDKILEKEKKIISIAFWSACILALPSLIVFLQVFDIFGMKTIIKDLYQPVYGMLNFNILSSFRSTSVFKDYFTASVYFSVVGVFIVAMLIKIKFSKIKRILLMIIFIVMYLSLLFVGRTGLVVIPLFVMLLIFLSIRSISFKKTIVILFFGIGTLTLLIYYLYINYADKLSWAFQVFTLFGDNESSMSSISDMDTMNTNFLHYIMNNLNILFVPHHTYDLTYEKFAYYTDNFYLQELYRYGIYGVFALLIFYIKLIQKTRHYPLLFVVSIMLIVLNYKGGNTWFMTKNIYIYAFIFIFTYKISSLSQGKKQ